MKFLVAALATVAVASDATHFNFMEYLATHGKSYSGAAEYETRYNNWLRIDQFIDQHNADLTQTHTVGHNKMSDWTAEEKSALMGLKNMPKPSLYPAKVSTKSGRKFGRDVDWRDSGCVTAVKDQGQCGSCWAFSATGALESSYCLAGNTLTSLSEQQLVSCAWRQGNLGCGGGMYNGAWQYLTNHMSMTEESYPYTAKSEFQECHYSESDGVTFVSSYSSVTPNDPIALVDALEASPVSVAIAADQDVFHNYVSGVITSASCGTSTDHAVLAVGYGTDETSGEEYFLVKNSWGADWGDAGYVKIGIAEGEGICGINTDPMTVYV